MGFYLKVGHSKNDNKSLDLKHFDEEKLHEKDNIKSHAYNIILFGLFLLALVIILKLSLNTEIQNGMFFTILVDTILINLVNILFTVGIGSLLLEYYGFIDYMRKRIIDVLIKTEYIDSLNNESKKELKSKIEKSLYYPNLKILDDNCLLFVVQNQIEPLLLDYYFKEYIVSIDCSIIESSFIKKKIYKRITYSQINNDNEQTLGVILNNFMYDIPDKDVFKLNKLIFDNKEYTFELSCTTVDDHTYNKSVKVTNDDFKFKDNAILEIEYETIVPLFDCHFVNRVSKPCQHYVIHFNYDENEMNIAAQGFGFMEYGDKERFIVRTEKNGKVIRYTDWILPGDGTIFTILPK